jgi:predicted O-methyltransferase YrrM
MEKLIQKSKKAFKEGGLGLFLKRLFAFISIKIKWITAWALRPLIIGEIEKFHAKNGEDVWNFTQSSMFGFLIRPMQVKSEFLGLLNILQEKKPEIILEIGTANGGTLFGFSKLAPDDAIIISIDLPEGPFGGGYPKSKVPLYSSFKKKNQKMFLLREDSHADKTLGKIKDILNGKKVDFLFIDGDHTYDGVKKDFELYGPLVKSGGIVAFHDVAVHPENIGCFVNLFWDEIKKDYKYKELIEDRNQGWGGIGVLFF